MKFTTKVFDDAKKAKSFFKKAKSTGTLHGVVVWGDNSLCLYSHSAKDEYERDSKVSFCRECRTY